MTMSANFLELHRNDLLRLFFGLKEHYVLVALGALVLSCLWTKYATTLHDIPGPFSASFSNWWKLKAVWTDRMPKLNVEAHEKYGSLVRIGPNHVSVSDPEAMRVIYGTSNIYRKSSFFPIAEGLYNGKPLANLFTTQNNEYHAALKRASGHAFSMTALAELEPLVDKCVNLLVRRIDKVSEEGKKPLDISAWLHYFAFDVLGEINFSTQFGFLKAGSDVDNNIATIDGILAYVSLIGQIPKAHKLLFGNPLLPKIFPNIEKTNEVQNFALRLIDERRKNPLGQHDILSRLLEVHEKAPEKLSFSEIVGLTTTNIIAGSDTTAITLRTIFYNLCHNRHIHDKLLKEVLETPQLEDAPISYAEASRLEYLSAVVNEALRIHPPTGFILERLVPYGGVTLCGKCLPANTVVGVNAWVMHHNKEVFGDDVDVFRPERWINSPPEMLKEMRRDLIAFGTGPRVCVGKNISLLEIWKVVPEILRNYDVSLAEPNKPWNVSGGWFTKQTKMDMIFRKRA